MVLVSWEFLIEAMTEGNTASARASTARAIRQRKRLHLQHLQRRS